MKSGPEVITAIAFFWAGFVCSISFMEAWLKFKAEGVTLSVGLSIGKKIFKALNRVEWLLFTLLIFVLFYFEWSVNARMLLPLILLILLVTQTFYLLPRLNKRADLIIEGQKVARSFIHVQYITFEFIKIVILVATGLVNFHLAR